MARALASDARNDLNMADIHDGAAEAHELINHNLELMLDAMVKPVPFKWYTDFVTRMPDSARWEGCFCFVDNPSGTTNHIGDKFFLGTETAWIRLDDSDNAIQASGVSRVETKPIEFPDQGSGAIVTAGNVDWETVITGCFQLVGFSMTRPWRLPSFADGDALPPAADWEGCLAYVLDPEPVSGAGTYSERVRLSNGTRWLSIDGSAEDVEGTPAGTGTRPTPSSQLTSITPVMFSGGTWGQQLDDKFAAWESYFTDPFPLPMFTQVQFFNGSYAANPEKWKYCMCVVTDAEGVSSGAWGDYLADEVLLISDGTDWLRYKDNTDPLVDLRTNMEAWWSLEEASGTRVDAHGSNDLTDNNTVGQGAGKVGNCADFEKSNNEYLSIADNASLSFGNEDFSICCWVKLESKASDMIMVGKWVVSGNQKAYLIGYSSGLDRFVFQISSDGSAETTQAANALGSPSTGTWYFIVVEHDSVNNTISIQVNNGTENGKSYSGGCFDNTAAFMLGAFGTGSGHFDGLIDEVAVFRSTLSQNARDVLYNGGNGLAYEKTR